MRGEINHRKLLTIKNSTSSESKLLINKHIEEKRSEFIPVNIQNIVWNRDGGKCAKCGSGERLEYDHIIPLYKGGANSVRNLQILCEQCGKEKLIG